MRTASDARNPIVLPKGPENIGFHRRGGCRKAADGNVHSTLSSLFYMQARTSGIRSPAMTPPPGKPAVLLDRDGTLVEEIDYLKDPAQLRLIAGAAAAVRRLNEAGVPVIIITNQSMIARGMGTEADLALIHERLITLLQAEGARIERIYYCPHHPDIGVPPYRATCDCRKPLPGLLSRAAVDLDLDLSRSTMIGDSLRDLEAGDAAGCRRLILVRTGHGAAEEPKTTAAKLGHRAIIHDDLAAAVDYLLQQETRAQRDTADRPIRAQSPSPKPRHA